MSKKGDSGGDRGGPPLYLLSEADLILFLEHYVSTYDIGLSSYQDKEKFTKKWLEKHYP
jgi:hypothetical protein